MASVYVNDNIVPKPFINPVDEQESNQKSFYMNSFASYLYEQEKRNQQLFQQIKNIEKMVEQLFELTCQLQQQNHHMNEKMEKQFHHQEQVEKEMNDRFEKQTAKIKELAVKHQLLNKKFQLKFEDLGNEKRPFRQLLQTLPPNYPVSTLFVNGLEINVSKFVEIVSATNIAYFIDGKTIKSIDSNQIDGMSW